MNIVYPDYYNEFTCLAGECRHTCCAGWEIDIDPVSLTRFKKDSIKHIDESGVPHFILQDGDRCPYLRQDGLCKMIIEHGPDYICDICRDHPRFRNFWTDITEVGLGLSCEAVAKIILGREKPMSFISDNGSDIDYIVSLLPEDENYLWNIRNEVIAKANSLSDPLQARLAEYFAYRQIPDALYDDMLEERIAFVWYSVNKITEGWNELEDQSFDALCETARKYSEYIEYNTGRLGEILSSL